MRDLDAPPKEEPRYTINEIFGFFFKVILYLMGLIAYFLWMAYVVNVFHPVSAFLLLTIPMFALGWLQSWWVNRPSNN